MLPIRHVKCCYHSFESFFTPGINMWSIIETEHFSIHTFQILVSCSGITILISLSFAWQVWMWCKLFVVEWLYEQSKFSHLFNVSLTDQLDVHRRRTTEHLDQKWKSLQVTYHSHKRPPCDHVDVSPTFSWERQSFFSSSGYRMSCVCCASSWVANECAQKQLPNLVFY